MKYRRISGICSLQKAAASWIYASIARNLYTHSMKTSAQTAGIPLKGEPMMSLYDALVYFLYPDIVGEQVTLPAIPEYEVPAKTVRIVKKGQHDIWEVRTAYGSYMGISGKKLRRLIGLKRCVWGFLKNGNT